MHSASSGSGNGENAYAEQVANRNNPLARALSQPPVSEQCLIMFTSGGLFFAGSCCFFL